MKWWHHAFAIDPPGPAEPTEPERQIVEMVCREIVRRHMTTPAIAFLEMSRPLNYLGSQVMHFFQPVVSALTDAEGYGHFAAFLERRGSIDYLCGTIERLEADCERKEASRSAGPPPVENTEAERHDEAD